MQAYTWQHIGGTVVLKYAVTFFLCCVLLCCVGCSVSGQAKMQQSTPEKPVLQADQNQGPGMWPSFADAYPENWEHELYQQAKLSK